MTFVATFIYILLLAWIICGLLAYGMCFNDFDTEFPEDYFATSNKKMAAMMGLMGIVGLITCVICSHRYGLRYRRSHEQVMEKL